MKTKMQLTNETQTDFWNDSCDMKELQEAVEQGAVGATSNPVIVSTVIKNNLERYGNFIDSLIKDNSAATEDDIAWLAIEELGKEAASLLLPVFNESGGKKGRLSLQVNPKYYRDAGKMVEHAKKLAAVAPNIAIKLPAVEAGITAMEELTACGITVTATVCFSVAQAIACAEAIEKGLQKAEDSEKLAPFIAIMVGRTDDQLKRVLTAERVSIDPGFLEWAGVAVFKKAYKIFKERNYHSTLLAAAYRNHLQWSEFIGGEVILSMPYKWWNQFNDSDIEIKPRMDNPVEKRILDELYKQFADFRKAYDEDGMKIADFVSYGATIHTLNQFICGYHSLLDIVREKMLV